jgi:hypothetical protein
MEAVESTKSDCMIDLNMSYGKYGSTRFLENINERESSLGRRLTREELLQEYRLLDTELFPMLMSRRLK